MRPIPFLFPIYENSPFSLLQLRLGMTLYDCLALYRNIAPHRTLSPAQALALEPTLSRQGLRGAVLYYDCQMDDARLCLENISHAAELGAVCANYCALTGFVKRGDRLEAARVTDQLGTATFEVRARVFINATGPWADQVCSLASSDNRQPLISPTKGVHLLLTKLAQRHAVVSSTAHRDGRIILVVPWGDYSLVGTTDTDFQGDPGAARAERVDIEYLLTEVRALFPDALISESDIVTTMTGVRALLRADSRAPSARSREHSIVQQGDNLLSVVGGKYTTYRVIAEQTVNAALDLLRTKVEGCRTAKAPLPNRRPEPTGEKISDSPSVYASDIAHACEQEMAMTLSDVMRRRTQLALSRKGGPETAACVGQLMALFLKWSVEEERAQLARYLNEWKQALP